MKNFLFGIVIAASLVISTSSRGSSNIPLIGSKAPSFTAKSTDGKIKFPQDFGSSWKILFSHPQDFTPVCSSELLEMANLKEEFEKLNVKVAVISTDDVEQHLLWKEYLETVDYKNRGQLKIEFPIIEDTKATVSETYGMLHQPTSTNRDIRGVFIIDGNNVVRSINFYPMEIGRNMEEIVRIVEALQTADQNQVLTPANWNEGDDVMVPYFPYTTKELEANPELKDQYYSVGNRLWFKKVNSLVSNQ
ncbi:MAG: peroxiredoxin [Prolixibacteraceae bacterium]|nr:peroxiredoxin [Prolixibacteraceae bacterium]